MSSLKNVKAKTTKESQSWSILSTKQEGKFYMVILDDGRRLLFPLKDLPEIKKVKLEERNKPMITNYPGDNRARYIMFKSSKYVFELTDDFLLIPQ